MIKRLAKMTASGSFRTRMEGASSPPSVFRDFAPWSPTPRQDALLGSATPHNH